MVSMRLKRFGSKAHPYYRIVVTDSRSSRESATIDEVGQFRPCEKENQVVLHQEKIQDWIKKGAVPSDTVKRILNKNGIQIVR